MKKDTEVKLLMQERRKGTSQRLAAARAGMSERTARKYEQAGQLPSHLKRPHTWATRANPFEEHWPWVIAQLERDPALQGSTLFALLCEQHPGCYRPTQMRTLQRHIARWRAVHGPEHEVIFEQRHQPGERAQSDAHPYGGSGRHHCRRALSSHGLSLCAHLLQRRSDQPVQRAKRLRPWLRGSRKRTGLLVECQSNTELTI